MAITVYVLQSQKDGHHYVGMTSNLSRRIWEHQSGKVKSTKSRIPFVILYRKEFISRGAAREHEKYLKTAAGRRYLSKESKLQQPSNLPD